MSSKMKIVQEYCEAVIGDAAHLTGVLEPWEVLDHFDAIPETMKSPFEFNLTVRSATFSGTVYFADNGICAAEIGVEDRSRKQKWRWSFDCRGKVQPCDRPKKMYDLVN
jgi:hypothetical protein